MPSVDPISGFALGDFVGVDTFAGTVNDRFAAVMRRGASSGVDGPGEVAMVLNQIRIWQRIGA